MKVKDLIEELLSWIDYEHMGADKQAQEYILEHYNFDVDNYLMKGKDFYLESKGNY